MQLANKYHLIKPSKKEISLPYCAHTSQAQDTCRLLFSTKDVLDIYFNLVRLD